MSGIAGIVHFDGAPVNATLLQAMAGVSPYRGPDGVGYWLEGHVGLVHMASHTTPEAVRETQPLLDAERGLALTADARLDNRDELIRTLTTKGYIQDRDPTDAALILAAHACWGERAAEHLRGDFAFALWDSRLRRMVLARDHFGTRPCYYHRSGSSLVFGSEVQQVRQFQGVGQQLNKRMIAFHIAATPAPHSWTFFQDVVQLPPAHVLVAEERGASASRYWQLDPQQSVRYRQDAEYAEHFLELFQKATIPKLRTLSPPGVLLSGGLDSSAVACTAADYLQHSGQAGLPRAFTWDFMGLDAIREADEQEYAREVAGYWHLPLTAIPAHEHWPLSDIERHPPDADSPFCFHYRALNTASLLAAKAQGVMVLLTGTPGDNLVRGPVYTFLDSLLTGRWLKLSRDLRQHARRWNASPGLAIRRGLLGPARKAFQERLGHYGLSYSGDRLPAWLSLELQEEAQFAEVVKRFFHGPEHRCRTLAQGLRYRQLEDPLLAQVSVGLEQLAAAHGLEFRHPWLDVGLFEFVLAVPQDQLVHAGTYKYVVQNGFEGLMPERVRLRRRVTVPTPLFRWALQEKEVGRIRSLLESSLAARRGYINEAAALAHFERYLSNSIRSEHPLWYTITLELWLRIYAD